MEAVSISSEPIAIIGMSCRFPSGANSPSQFWRILEAGLDAIGEIPASRWDKAAYYDVDGNAPGKMYTTRGGFMDVAVDRFDAAFFGISPKEAASMDPQQRLVLELSWEALEDAAINPETLRGGDAGVFIGVSSLDYADMCIHDNIDRVTSYALTGNCHSALAGRVSYILGLQGPSLAIDTACSSSLVAVDNACAYLRLRKTGLAIAGGFNLMLSPDMQICLTKLQALSPEGLCRSFDAAASGYARSEGGGLVVLKRLTDAVSDGDRILGLIRGSYVNQDGQSTGISAPNGKSQEKVILSALREAGLTGADLDYIETHGTGTRVGDKTEITAIGNVMRVVRNGAGPLMVGSVKSNIGHLEAASGIAGLQKVVLAMQHGLIPANLHFETPNPEIAWDEFPVRVVDRHTPWPKNGRTRRAGISSFGFVGTNSHLILEEPPIAHCPEEGEPSTGACGTLLLSARTPEALRALIRRYQSWLHAPPPHGGGLGSADPSSVDLTRLADLCHTAATGRQHFEYRAAACGRDLAELDDGLAELLEEDAFPRTRKDTSVVFLFTGQGAQYFGMGRQLYRTQSVFRDALDHCERLYQDVEGTSLLDMLYGEDADPERVHNTRYTQPLLFSIEYALAQLWLSWGVRPAACAGHSVGEYAAACLAGVISVDDALRLVTVRGRLMSSVPGSGLMAAVFASRDEVAPLVNGRVTIAAHNAPASVVIGGFRDAVMPVLEQLQARGIQHQMLTVSHAFHSPQMDPVLDEFRAAFAGVTLHDPQIPLVSNVTARAAEAGALTNPDYWVRHLRNAVRMSESLSWLGREGYGIFLEVGPKPVLLTFASECLEIGQPVLVGSMKPRVPDLLTLAESVGHLYRAGVDLDWGALHSGAGARKISLPTYPFSGPRHWVEPSGRTASPAAVSASFEGHPLLGRRITTGALEDTVIFQMDIQRGAHYFFAEHVILGVETAPGAALLGWVWQAARELFGDERLRLSDITMTQPLILYEDDRVGQIIVRDVSAQQCAFEFLSREVRGEQAWTTHCKGYIERDVDASAPSETWPVEHDFQLSGAEFYARMEALGYHYGPLFRGIRQASASDIREGGGGPHSLDVLCEWRSVERDARTQEWWITPHDLDIVFQSPAVALMMDPPSLRDSGHIYVPFYIKSLRVLQPFVPGEYRVRTRTRAGDDTRSQSLEIGMEVRNAGSEVCLAIDGFISIEISKQALLREGRTQRLQRLVYEEEWKRLPLSPRVDATIRTWLLFVDENASCDGLVEHLSQGADVRVIRLQDWDSPQSWVSALEPWQLDPEMSLGVVYLCSGASFTLGRRDGIDIARDVDRVLRRVLYLTQACLDRSRRSRLYLVTAGACSPDEDGAPTFRSVGVEGFAAAAQLEHPELCVTHVDLSSDTGDAELGSLADELRSDSPDMRVCLRHGHRYVSRLRPWRAEKSRALALPAGPFTLDTGESAALHDFRLASIERRAPAPDEVEFEVVAAGLNFKDVLRALGELRDSTNRIGGEAAGIVVRVGSDVGDLKPGDAIISWDMAGGAFSSHQTVPRRFVRLKPEFLSFEEASTVPISFMTAEYGLFELGALKKGERVLIHAGTGGVGLAAVQLALNAGAEVFSTAGSDYKRRLLRQIGVSHVFDSRGLEFAEQIMQITGERGVDLVLNSLTGAALRHSLRLLAPGGRFIELGKREVWTAQDVAAENPAVSYQAFDLTDVVASSPNARLDLLEKILGKIAEGTIRPLPLRVFPIAQASRAYRFMSQARHVGRIALSNRSALSRGELPLRTDGAYLITGGLGALGLEIAARMAAHPVARIILVGRRSPSAEALARIDALRAAGPVVDVVQCDLADRADCDRLFGHLDCLPHPLRGVIHAAGVLHDRTIAQQTWDGFVSVLAPKVQGAWNLHEATRDRLLDFFVLFSSAASTIGNGGQSNYAAANSFMNALAIYRRALGLCASSICWGPWAKVGMAASGTQPGLKMAHNGLLGIEPAEGISALLGIIEEDLAVPTVVDMNWDVFLGTAPADWADTYLQNMRASRSVSVSRHEEAEEQAGGNALQRLKEAGAEKRLQVAVAFLRKVIGRVTGHDDAAMVPTDVPLARLGLDSLMVMAFRNQVQKKLSIDLPLTLLTPQSTLEDMAAHVLAQVASGS